MGGGGGGGGGGKVSAEGSVYLAGGRECLPEGGGVCLGEFAQVEVASACGDVCLGKRCLPRWDVHLLPVDRMTDASENITFPQLLLRTVKTAKTATQVTLNERPIYVVKKKVDAPYQKSDCEVAVLQHFGRES